jgi:hypothetical protein
MGKIRQYCAKRWDLVKEVMRPLLLCRERLYRLLSVLDREGGSCSLRDLERMYRIHSWEMEQAEDAGWVTISERKPAVGRPSRVATKLSENGAARLPPWRFMIPKELSCRHWRFALESTMPASSGGRFGFSLSSATRAYLIAFPKAKSRAGGAASASRLKRKPMIQAARRWFQSSHLMGSHEQMPATPRAIYARLAELREEQEKRLAARSFSF